MNFKLKNNSDKPQYCDSLSVKIPANGESRILTEGEYLSVLRHSPGYEWGVLIPVAVESESRKQPAEMMESSETLTRKGRGRHKQESEDE